MRSMLIDRGSDAVVVGTAINARLEDVRIAAALLLGASVAAEAELAAQAWLRNVVAAAGQMAERAHWLTVEWLPKYAPELNDIEIVWGDLKARHLAHRTFTDRRRRPQRRAKSQSVGSPENLCLGLAVNSPERRRPSVV